MNKSLYEFSKENIKPKTEQNNAIPKNLENTAKQYAEKSKEELFSIFQDEVAKQKQNNTFDINKLEKSLEMLSPMLTSEQKKNIKEILNQIK